MDISIKKASLQDLEDIIFVQKNNEIILSNEIIENDLSNTSKMYLVAKNYNLIIGYVACDLNYDHADVTAFLVDKTYRNLGIGSTLMKHLIYYLTKEHINDIMLEVRSSNTIAIKLYTKEGFEFVSKRSKYYGDDDAFIFKYNPNNKKH